MSKLGLNEILLGLNLYRMPCKIWAPYDGHYVEKNLVQKKGHPKTSLNKFSGFILVQ